MSIHLVSPISASAHLLAPLPPTLHSITPATSHQASTSLPPSTLRLRPALLSLAANNRTYHAKGGSHVMVPAWGHATVLASTVPSVPTGTVLWGFWPLTDAPVDLCVEQVVEDGVPVEGHLVDVSVQREGLMSLYNRYIVLGRGCGVGDVEVGSREAEVTASLRPVWEMGFLLNFSFPVRAKGMRGRAVHPLGMGLEWREEDGELGHAVVVVLEAASKTGRAIAWQMLKRVRDGEIKGLVLSCSLPGGLREVYGKRDGLRIAKYEGVAAEAAEVVQRSGAKKVLLIDCGSPITAGPAVVTAVRGKAMVTILFVGSGPAPYAGIEDSDDVKKVQGNASGIKDEALVAVGSSAYFRDLGQDWKAYYQEEGATWKIKKR
ncbi:hypothetical protein CAC42_7065 [Sphaceloma murrayae]|uniref:Uncharacterized protein n=1 Tax=Sphaceloma murrayae TaxID=2082308 RepID=A0A2K1QQR1_9PEZI|nr:hypothetical protein CAC42_7065 [Sphaceloma murrayae]